MDVCTFSDIHTLTFFPGVSHFSRESPGFCQNLPGFEYNMKINLQVIEAHVGFSNTCGNGLINLSFVPKSKSFFDRG